MKTLEQIKKNKNYLACRKGYPINPEGFSFEFLNKRFGDELLEFYNSIPSKDGKLIESQCYFNDRIMDELADLSNIIDYISTKITVRYITKYKDEEQGEKKNEQIK